MEKTNKIILLMVVLMALTCISAAQQRFEQKADSLMALTLNPDEPGGVIVLATGQETIIRKAYGMANISKQQANTTGSVFNLASVAKHFTAYAILLLEKDGKINLDDNVQKYLPRLPDYGHQVSIRHLLHHTSGIASTDNLRLFAGISLEGPWNHNDEMELIYRYPVLNFIPGEQYVYSNAGYSLLASIIEAVSGMSYADFLQQQIFDPLEMANTYVYDRPGKEMPGVTTGYMKQGEDFVANKGSGDTSYGGSNIFISADDLQAWINYICDPESEKRELNQRLFNKEFVLNNGDTINYSLGMMVDSYKGMKLVSHSGGDLGYRAQLWIFPEQSTVIFALFNTDHINSRNIVSSLADHFLADHIIEKKPAEKIAIDVDSGLLQKYEGIFRMPDGMDLGFKLRNDTLWLVITGAPDFQLFAQTDNYFFLEAFDAQVTFVADAKGDINEIVWHQTGKDYQAFRTKETIIPEPWELKPYAGIYFHETLEVEYPIDFIEDQLIMTTPETFQKHLNIDKVILSPMGEDRFISKDSPLGVIEFSRNDNNEITGFRFVDVGRIKNLAFSKR